MTLYRIVELDWVLLQCGEWFATSCFMGYNITPLADGSFRLHRPPGYLSTHETLEAAQAAASGYYRDRLSSALTPVDCKCQGEGGT